MTKALRFGAVGLVAASAFAVVWAQTSQRVDATGEGTTTERTGTLNLDCKLGSFRSIDGKGTLDVSFEGALLISKLEGDHQVVSGDLRKEYDENGRTCYTGKGRVVVNGSWRAVQWLGANMTGQWEGVGILRIGGEFWKNPETGELETGRYWYDDPEEWQNFPSAGVTNITVPEATYGADTNIQPKVRGGSN